MIPTFTQRAAAAGTGAAQVTPTTTLPPRWLQLGRAGLINPGLRGPLYWPLFRPNNGTKWTIVVLTAILFFTLRRLLKCLVGPLVFPNPNGPHNPSIRGS